MTYAIHVLAQEFYTHTLLTLSHTHTPQWSGRQPPPCIDAPPSMPLLKHVMNQVYSKAITSPEELNYYEPFSPEVRVWSEGGTEEGMVEGGGGGGKVGGMGG